jgi:excinuclease ABC subunit C
MKTVDNPLESGLKSIKSVQKTLDDSPGVYRMLDDKKTVLYVGKAKNLQRRVASYTRPDKLPMRLKRMIAETRSMEIVETHTELEALLLEFNMIKELKPAYNILLKDDKAFPHILVTRNHDYPRLVKHRGKETIKGDYFGPFASAGAVGRTINTIQKIFQLRNCTDAYFETRKRPCLQYHIKRCTAPCVGHVTKAEYESQVQNTQDFLNGKSQSLQKDFADKMKQAAEAQKYEQAAKFRDRIKALTAIQSSQIINLQNTKNADVIAIIQDSGLTCVTVFFIRNGQNFGNRTYFPRADDDETMDHIFGRFIIEFYTRNPVVPDVFVNTMPADHGMLSEMLSIQLGKKSVISQPSRGDRKSVVDMAVKNALSSLERHKAQKSSDAKGLERVKEIFEFDDIPQRIEVYDNSHTGGEHMLGAMIVASPDGFQKSQYRKFNLKDTEASDDYGGMREVMKRRFGRAIEEGITPEDETWPDLVLIDGGKGQLSSVTEILEELGITDQLNVVAIAKGPDRNAGREDFYMNGRTPFRLPPNDVGLFYLQRLRDEAHRFAIGSMRTRRAKTIEKSPLDDVAGIGPKRKKALLNYFGSGKAAARASLIDLQKVDGISKAFAQKIYDHFHG